MFNKAYTKFFIFLIYCLFIISCDGGNDDVAEIEGCTDENACNYDETATVDDGTCLEPEIELSSFSLLDLNETSSTYGEFISIETFTQDIKLFYFSNNEN